MAYLYTNPDEEMVRVEVRGLDSNYSNTTRDILLEVYPYGSPNNVKDDIETTLANGIATSPTYRLYNLSPDTHYEVRCVISNINGGTYPNVTLYDDFYTDEAPTFVIYPPSPSNWGITGVTSTSISVWFNKVSNATHTGVYVNGNHYNDYTGSSATITGLNPNMEYQINVDSFNDVENESSDLSDSKYATTDLLPLSVPTNISVYGASPNSFQWTAYRDPLANRVRVYVGTSINPTTIATTTTSSSGAIAGLNPNTKYYVRFRSYDSVSGSISSYSSNYTITTLSNQLEKPVWKTSETDRSFTYIYAEVYTVTGATSYVWELWNAAKSSRIAVITNSWASVAWNALDPGTTYNLRVMVKATGYLDSAWSNWYELETHTATPWQWWSDVGQGDPFMITRAEWIAFQDRINTVRNGRGLAYYQFTTTYSAVDTGKPMTAALMNECVVAINAMLPSGSKMATVSSGQVISAAFMEGIKNKLNSLM